MFWKQKKNNTENNNQKTLEYLHLFTAEYAGDSLSGISIEPFSGNRDVGKEILRTFEWNGNKVPENRQNFWRHAFIYHHDLPSSISLATVRARCYQNPEELNAFIGAVREYKRATLIQENIKERLDSLKEAKKALLLKVID